MVILLINLTEQRQPCESLNDELRMDPDISHLSVNRTGSIDVDACYYTRINGPFVLIEYSTLTPFVS